MWIGMHLLLYMHIDVIMQHILFGESLSWFKENKLINSTKKTSVVYIASASRLKELFTVKKLTLIESIVYEYKYKFCRKVILKHRTNRRSIITCIIDENDISLILVTLGSQYISIFRLLHGLSNLKVAYGKYGEYHCCILEERAHS